MSNYTRMSNDDLICELRLRDRSIQDMGRRFADAKEALQEERDIYKEDEERRSDMLKVEIRGKEALEKKNRELKNEIKGLGYKSIENVSAECYPCSLKKTEIEDLKRRIENQKKSMENMELADPALAKEIKDRDEIIKQRDKNIVYLAHVQFKFSKRVKELEAQIEG